MKKCAVLTLALALLCSAAAMSLVGCDPKPQDERPSFIRAENGVLFANDEPIGLVGTNLGGWLVQESWLVPTEVGAEYGQIDMLLELANRFGKEDALKLVDIYEDNWVTEADFEFVKSLGMNCVRLPFSYMNLCDAIQLDEETGKYERTPFEELALREDAFKRIDQALEMCKKHGLYLILDMHGAVGSQNGNDHSGDIAYHDEGGLLWRDDDIGKACRDKTKELWVEIAARYKDETTIAFYDLLNEPGIKDGNGNQKTNERVWNFFDELYGAIREKDANHAICMESCWEVGNLPSPSEYGWENVIYQYHHYNWAGNGVKNSRFYFEKKFSLSHMREKVPVFIGEFNVWGDAQRGYSEQSDEEAWRGVVELYAGMGWHFTTWNFKHAATNSSWGLLNLKEDLRQADFKKDTFEQIAEAWRGGNSQNYRENTSLTACIKPYLATFNATGEERDMEYAILN